MRRWIADKLERSAWRGSAPRLAASVWERFAEPVRPVELPEGARVIGVGGARLGGDGKTPITLELARALARRGERVAVVARRYPSRPGAARQVSSTDSPALVGDEPLLLSRLLGPDAVPVVSATSYAAGLALAARLAPTILVDGLLQTAPRRLSESLLVVGRGPLSAHCPPAGDRRAAWSRLLRATDRVLLEAGAAATIPAAAARPAYRFEVTLEGVRCPSGQLRALAELRGRRFGLLLALARPDRVLDALVRHGLEPSARELHADHAALRRSSAASTGPSGDVELWVTSPKCRVKLGEGHRGAPIWTLEHRVNLPPTLLQALAVQNGLQPEGPW